MNQLPYIDCFRSPDKKDIPSGKISSQTENQIKTDKKYEKGILCRNCLRLITNPSQKISIEGAHTHAFANPHGIVFEIGCFRAAAGCGYVGKPTDEFSWFKGCKWQVALCGFCLSHIGWLFSSLHSDNFFGLILDRLVETEN